MERFSLFCRGSWPEMANRSTDPEAETHTTGLFFVHMWDSREMATRNRAHPGPEAETRTTSANSKTLNPFQHLECFYSPFTQMHACRPRSGNSHNQRKQESSRISISQRHGQAETHASSKVPGIEAETHATRTNKGSQHTHTHTHTHPHTHTHTHTHTLFCGVLHLRRDSGAEWVFPIRFPPKKSPTF